MKIDAYTKAVLTVIAACLVWMCVNGATPTTHAQAKPQDPTQPTPVVLVDASGAPVRTMPVTIVNPELAVAVRSIQRGGVWDPIQVQVMREPPTQKPTP
jgi:hypothetical protein